MRTTDGTLDTPLTMDAMRPGQAFGTPPAPTALDPRRWFGTVLATLAGVAARLARPGATAPAAPVGTAL